MKQPRYDPWDWQFEWWDSQERLGGFSIAHCWYHLDRCGMPVINRPTQGGQGPVISKAKMTARLPPSHFSTSKVVARGIWASVWQVFWDVLRLFNLTQLVLSLHDSVGKTNQEMSFRSLNRFHPRRQSFRSSEGAKMVSGDCDKVLS